jgi:hypothetical protein
MGFTEMNTPSLTTETDNLVLFPSSKNFPVGKSEEIELDDPIMDILNEFSDASLDLGLEALLVEEPTYGSLEAYMNRHKDEGSLTTDDKLVLLIDERIGQIDEARARIKFYLDELEMFLPRRR